MSSLWLRLAGTALVAALATACSESNDTTTGGPTGSDAGTDTGTTRDASVTDSTKPGSDAAHPPADVTQPSGDAGAGGVIINEISGKGVNYVELYNAGSTPFDLGGWGVTEAKDHDGGPGTPKTPVLFPEGTTLAPGAYAIATTGPTDGGTVLDDGGCPASVCVYSTWGISNSAGAHIYLLNPSAATVADQPFPGETTDAGESWGRLPNGTGPFVLNAQTPGKANAAP